MVLLATLAVSFLFINSNYAQTKFDAHHFDAYFYPTSKIISGLTPGVDFNSLYGYYSYFFSAVMQLFGTKSILGFSFLIALLVLIILSCLGIFTYRLLKNKVVWVLTMFSLIYTIIIRQVIRSDGNYYLQYMPHRVFFPALLLIYLLLYLRFRQRKRAALPLLIGGALLSAFALFWNLETGVVVWGTWICFLGYEVFFFHSLKDKKTWFSIGKILLMAVIAPLLLYFLILDGVTFLRTGSFLDFRNVLFGQSVFAGSGFFMLRMPLWHPWLYLVLVYAVGLAISIKRLHFMSRGNAIEFETNSLIFALAILGAGLFSYYQGRSHNAVFPSILYPGIILLGIFLDRLIKVRKNYFGTERICKSLIIFCISAVLILFSSSTVSSFFLSKDVQGRLNKEETLSTNVLQSNLNLAQGLKQAYGEIDFVLPNESYYYIATNQPDRKPFPGYVDLFTYEDCGKIINYLEQHETALCTNQTIYQILTEKYTDGIKMLTEKKYTIIALEENDWILFIPQVSD